MIELSTTSDQTLAANQSLVFDNILLKTGCTECFRKSSGLVSLTQRNSIYEVSFNCNIGGVASGDAQIGLTLNGAPLPETNTNVVTAAAGDTFNVSASTFIRTCCCDSGIGILLTNTGTTDINVTAAARLSIRKIA